MVKDRPQRTEANYVKPSKRQARRKRRQRFARLADEARKDELIRGVGPSIEQSADYHMQRACGWDAKDRSMRLREPPTRSTNGGFRLNRRNGWSQDGDAKLLVAPKESSAWLWWLSLGDDAQDDVYELSMKCSEQARDGVSREDPDAVEMLRESKTFYTKAAKEGEDARDWGRLA